MIRTVLAVFALVFVPSVAPSLHQQAEKPLPVNAQKLSAPAPLSELEDLKVALVRKQAEVKDLTEQLSATRIELQNLRLQAMILQATPVRDGYVFDWDTLKFTPIKK